MKSNCQNHEFNFWANLCLGIYYFAEYNDISAKRKIDPIKKIAAKNEAAEKSIDFTLKSLGALIDYHNCRRG
ncbi:MAG: hypothetical protein U0V74_07355 [Chitinophagales bacterium]